MHTQILIFEKSYSNVKQIILLNHIEFTILTKINLKVLSAICKQLYRMNKIKLTIFTKWNFTVLPSFGCNCETPGSIRFSIRVPAVIRSINHFLIWEQVVSGSHSMILIFSCIPSLTFKPRVSRGNATQIFFSQLCSLTFFTFKTQVDITNIYDLEFPVT